MQRALLQFARPANAPLVRKALKLAGREELIGFGRECLVRPEVQKRYDKPKSTIAQGNTQRGAQGKPKKPVGKGSINKGQRKGKRK